MQKMRSVVNSEVRFKGANTNITKPSKHMLPKSTNMSSV